uniref:Uncharacterized protein n=1 Tax=Arundo donax TaxID=35708 RepID=A0A0A9D3D5_ARUDO
MTTWHSRAEAFYFAMLMCFLIMFKVSITCKKEIIMLIVVNGTLTTQEQKDYHS